MGCFQAGPSKDAWDSSSWTFATLCMGNSPWCSMHCVGWLRLLLFADACERAMTRLSRCPWGQGDEVQWLSPRQWDSLSAFLRSPSLLAVVLVSELPLIFQPQEDEEREEMQVRGCGRFSHSQCPGL